MEVETIKCLGFELDNQITWKKHFQLVLRNLSSAYIYIHIFIYIIYFFTLRWIPQNFIPYLTIEWKCAK
jgi:hypothetical protein